MLLVHPLKGTIPIYYSEPSLSIFALYSDDFPSLGEEIEYHVVVDALYFVEWYLELLSFPGILKFYLESLEYNSETLECLAGVAEF